MAATGERFLFFSVVRASNVACVLDELFLVILHFRPTEGFIVFQARAFGADDRTCGLLLLAPVPKVRGEILSFPSNVPRSLQLRESRR